MADLDKRARDWSRTVQEADNAALDAKRALLQTARLPRFLRPLWRRFWRFYVRLPDVARKWAWRDLNDG